MDSSFLKRLSLGAMALTAGVAAADSHAVQAFHDANGNSTPEIPPEGFAFGNNAAWPPSFSAAAVQVSGASRMTMRMQYVDLASAPAGQAAQPPRSGGADAPPGVTLSFLRRELGETP